MSASVLINEGFQTWYLMTTVLMFIVFYFLKNIVSKRWRLSRELPGMKIGLLDFWGDANNFPKTVPEKYSNCLNIYLLQTFSGYAKLFRKETFFTFWFSFTPFVFIVKAKTVEQLLSGTKHIEKAWTYSWLHSWLNTGLLTSHGQKWKARRKLITPCFHFDILRDFLPVIDKQSKYLVENVFREETDKDWTDVTMPITLCTLDVICETTLGVSVNAQKNSKSEYVQALMRAASIVMNRMAHPAYFIDIIFNLSSLGREFKKDVKLLHEFTRSVIKKKKAKLQASAAPAGKRKALMDMLLEHHLQNESLTEEDIREEVDTFTFAGHDTTSMGISWALYLIGLHKDVQTRLHEETDTIFGDNRDRPVTNDDLKEMNYLERVLKESQRLYPSVPMFGRKSTEDTVLNGYKIPKGAVCLIFTNAIHKDPDEFPDPEKFDPDRFLPENSINRHPYAFIPFSAGPRNCIGQRFA